MINLTINNKPASVPEGTTILEAAREIGIYIPSLCYLKDVHKFGSCRICMVEVEGARTLQASCITEAKEGMVVRTNTPEVLQARKLVYELLLSDHPQDCLHCSRNQSCELQTLGDVLNVTQSRFDGEHSTAVVDVSPSIPRDMGQCILCRRCITACNQIQNVGVINMQNRGFKSVVSPAMELPLESKDCTYCGQCTVVCPVGALKETDAIEKVWRALADPKKRVVVQTAPAIRAAIGEEFGLPPGTRCTGQLTAALRELGFDDVFDTNFAADLTILEEGTEFLDRVKKAFSGKETVLPMMTSCSPGWIKYIEHFYPGSLAHLSTCKSPHTMLGAVVKSYYAKKIGVDPEDILWCRSCPVPRRNLKSAVPRCKMTACPMSTPFSPPGNWRR